MVAEFKKFALRGNVVDLAIGVIIGAAFGAIIQSLVSDVMLPVVGALTGGFDFSNHFIALSPKVTADSLAEARKQGAVLAWGNFLTLVINFIIVAWMLFLLVKVMNRLLQAEAAKVPLHPPTLAWQKFPQAESIVAFARGLGAARGGNVPDAKRELARLEALRDTLTAAKNTYWANQAEIQRLAVTGWIARAEGKNDDAVALLRQAADKEDATEKHPVTPGAIQPAREMLAELLIDLNQPAKALAEFEASQKVEPNRFHGLAGAARAAELAGDRAKAKTYYEQLIALAKTADSERPEIVKARAFVGTK